MSIDTPLSSHGLSALEARLAEDLALLDLPTREWMPVLPEGDDVLDVAIIGAGMAGLAAAAALKLIGVRTRLFDRSPEGYEGPWATTARMQTLRSPKQLTGPALGLPALTFRAWFEAFDADRFDAAIERDARDGKLDAFAEEAIAAYRAGQSRDL